MAEVYPWDNIEVVKHEWTDTSQVTKRDYDYIDGKVHVTVPPASEETVKQSTSNIVVLFLGTWIKKVRKMTNQDLKDAIEETGHVNDALKGDDSKDAQKEKMKHDIAKDEKKRGIPTHNKAKRTRRPIQRLPK